MNKLITYTRHLIVAGFLLATGSATAQYYSNAPALLQPSGTMYFQNQYLANPAMAGIDTGLHINAAHRRQFNGIDGAPITTFFTADGAFGNRGAAGLNIFSDKAGLLNRTRVALSYAYHMPLNDRGQFLHFGMSVAVNNQRVSYHGLDGDWNDPSLANFNRREDYFEGEFGMAYTNQHLTVQAALPNLRSLFSGTSRGVDDGSIGFAAVSYKFNLEGTVGSIEPKVCYRSVKGFDDIIDAGLNINFLDNAASLMGIYHSSGSVTGGIGVRFFKTAGLQFLYTTQTKGVKTNIDGMYELGVRVDLFK